MKTNRQRTSVIVLLMLMTNGLVQAQKWTFGPKVNLGLSSRQSSAQVQVDKAVVTTGSSSGDGSTGGFGAFARRDQARWYGQVELNRQRSQALYYYVDSPGMGFSGGNSRTRYDARLLGGYKLLPWLRVNAGLSAVRYLPNARDYYQTSIDNLERQAEQYPELGDGYKERVRTYEVAQAVEKSVRRSGLEGSIGLGADISGLTIDLSHIATLTPLIDGITVRGKSYGLRQQSSLWSLQVGYRLFPLKGRSPDSRKNRAYERLKRDIPFYRNEFHASAGLLGEDIGSAFIYENRYTRYLTRRFGLTAGLNLMRPYETYDNGFLPNQFTQVQLVTGLRVLPLYSRRHTIGLSLGPMLVYKTGFRVNSGSSQTVNGQSFRTVNFGATSRANQLTVDVQGTVDYHFAATDRIIIGPWLRVTGDYAYYGMQVGYRF